MHFLNPEFTPPKLKPISLHLVERYNFFFPSGLSQAVFKENPVFLVESSLGVLDNFVILTMVTVLF